MFGERFKKLLKHHPRNCNVEKPLNMVFEEKMQMLKSLFLKSQKSCRLPWDCDPLHMLKELEHQARANICTLNFQSMFNVVIPFSRPTLTGLINFFSRDRQSGSNQHYINSWKL